MYTTRFKWGSTIRLLTAIILTVGCQDAPPSDDSAAVQPSATDSDAASQPADGEMVELPEPDEAAMEAAAEEARRNQEAAQKMVIAEDIPVYPGAERTGGSSGGVQTSIGWKTSDPKEKVMEFYTASLPESGWEITTNLSFGRIEAKKERRKLLIDIARGTNPPTEILVVELRNQR